MSVRLDLKRFPFDRHQLGISLLAAHDATHVEFESDDRIMGMAENLSISGWAIAAGVAETTAEILPSTGRPLPRFYYRFSASRNAGFYSWKVFLPLTLIVFMSWAVFYIDPLALPSQVSVAVTSMLTLIAYLFALGHLLPRISYLTLADKFTLSSAILIFVALVEVVAVNFLARGGKEDLSHKIQKTARWAFPVAFAVVCTTAFLS